MTDGEEEEVEEYGKSRRTGEEGRRRRKSGKMRPRKEGKKNGGRGRRREGEGLMRIKRQRGGRKMGGL